MNEILACRGCRHNLASDAGCALCLPVKPHLVIVSQVDEDNVPLATVASEAVAILRKQLTMLKADGKGETTYNYGRASEARAVSNAIAKLVDSARKVVQDGADAVGAMSFQEKTNLFLEWTGTLPGAHRRKIIAQLLEQNQAKLDSLGSETQVLGPKDGSDVVVN